MQKIIPLTLTLSAIALIINPVSAVPPSLKRDYPTVENPRDKPVCYIEFGDNTTLDVSRLCQQEPQRKITPMINLPESNNQVKPPEIEQENEQSTPIIRTIIEGITTKDTPLNTVDPNRQNEQNSPNSNLIPAPTPSDNPTPNYPGLDRGNNQGESLGNQPTSFPGFPYPPDNNDNSKDKDKK